MRLWGLIVALVALQVGLAVPSAALETFETDELTIETASGERHTFVVEMALTPGQRRQGLMYRRSMAADHGMLFVYEADHLITMWMKNTYIPLDMVFVDSRGIVVSVAERAVPRSLKTIAAAGKARGVVELNSGTAARLGIKAGDRVLHPAFGQGP